MEISALTLRVLLLFFPGVLCAMLVGVLTRQRDESPARFLTSAFVLGMASYLLLYAVRGLCISIAGATGLPEPLDLSFFPALVDEKQRIAWGEIALAALVSSPMAVGVSALVNHKVFLKVARRFGVSRGYAEHDVWTLLFNSPDVEWVLVRDLAHDLAFKGAVDAFSDSPVRAEVLLRNVSVYQNSSGTKLYETKRVYLSRPSEALVLELGVSADDLTWPGGDDVEDRGSPASGRQILEGGTEPGRGPSSARLPSGADGPSVPAALGVEEAHRGRPANAGVGHERLTADDGGPQDTSLEAGQVQEGRAEPRRGGSTSGLPPGADGDSVPGAGEPDAADAPSGSGSS